MSLTRKALAAMGIESEKIEQIIEMHTETVQAIKEERDAAREEAKKLKEDAGKLPDIQKELDDLKAEKDKAQDFKAKYEETKKEFDEFKGAQAAAKKKADIEKAARAYFKDQKITSDENLEIVMRGSRDEISNLELDEEGKIKDTKALDDLVKGVYAKFVASDGVQGASTPTPPANNGGQTKTPSIAAQLAQQFRNEHYGTKED